MEVKPFKAFRYNAGVVGDAGRCVAPPYDVISEQERDKLYRKSKYNIVRITKGKATSRDNGQHNQYTRAAEFLQMWIAEGVLKQDDREAIYGYVQDFEVNGVAFQRLSFIALGRLEEFGQTVRPHEQVFEKPLLDRLSLERATAARFGLVFMLYEDPQEVADHIITRTATREPLVDFVDEQGVRHRLYAITADSDVDAIVGMMRDKSCIIADGHHRYTTGLTYMRESGNPAAQYQMIAFTNTRQKGLVVLATHRLVGGIEDFQPRQFLLDLKNNGFTVTKFGSAPDVRAGGQAGQQMLRTLADLRRAHDQDLTVFGIYLGGGIFFAAVLEDKSRMAAAAPDMSAAWRALDVSVLQRLVLERMLRIDEGKMGDPNYVEYIKDLPHAMEEMVAQVDAGCKQIAFFTGPVKMQQLARVTEAGERMPHKSTYFYPKMYTGLTIQKL